MCDLSRKGLVLFLTFFSFFVVVNPAQSREAEQLVCYPTDVTQAGELSYLRDSVRLMLASRLATVAGVEIRLEKKMDSKRDFPFYRIWSRLASNKEGIELSATVYEPSSESPLHFQSAVDDSTEVLKALDMLVADIGRTLFEEQDTPELSKEPEEQVEQEVDHATAHPDRAFKATSGYGLSIAQEDFIAEMALLVKTTERYKSKVLPFQSQAMTVGDIDGDSVDEILVSSNGKLFIYQLQDSQIKDLATVKLPGGLRVHGLNATDLDGNGLMEIYISSTRDKQPRSFVLEYHPETGVKWLYKNVRYYLRPLDIPGEGLVLCGQTSGVSGMVESGIYRMNVQIGDKITRGERLHLPDSVDLFDFVYADLDGNKLFEIVRINNKEQLEVFNSDQQLLYTSPSGFSGRELSRGLTVPIRLIAYDFDGDGGDDIVIVDNELYSPKFLSKTKLYKNGHVRGLSWDGKAFFEMWHTNIFRRAVVDYQFLPSPTVSESTGNSGGRLFVVEPEKGDLLEGFLLGRGGSRLYVYGMEFVPKRVVGKEK